MKSEIYIDVKNCQRCGENHKKLLFLELNNPVDDYTYWGWCPTKFEPVLLAIREKDETQNS